MDPLLPPSSNDVDIFMLMEDAFTRASWSVRPLFWVRRLAGLGSETAAIEFWQTKRDGGRHGIVEVVT